MATTAASKVGASNGNRTMASTRSRARVRTVITPNSVAELAMPGSVGDLFWEGYAGTTFWVDPAERLIVVGMIQNPAARNGFRRVGGQYGQQYQTF